MITFDRWLAVVGIVVGAVGLYYAWFLHRKSIANKLLTLAYTNAIPLVLPHSAVAHSYNGGPVNELSRAFVLLWNRGTAPIEQDDFICPITIPTGDKLLAIEVYDKDPAADVVVQTDRAIIVNLLRPGEAAVLKLDAAEVGYRADLSIRMKAADMSVVMRNNRSLIPLTVSSWLWVSGIISFSYFDIPHFAMKMPNVIESVATILLFLGPPTVVAALSYPLTRAVLIARTPSVVWRFFEIKALASRIHKSWRSLSNNLGRIELK
jgi:hypothetical protein